MSAKLTATFKHARRAGVPLVTIDTPDPEATMQTVVASLNGGDDIPVIQWDLVRGLRGRNKAGAAVADQLIAEADQDGEDPTVGEPAILLKMAESLPEGSILFVLNAGHWLGYYQESPQKAVVQGIWNLRDLFKQDKRQLVLLGAELELPAELRNDIISLEEPLPSEDELKVIVSEVHDAAGLEVSDEDAARVAKNIRGLSAFVAENVVAMSLRKDGVDFNSLVDRTVKQIEAVRGLTVYRGGETFEQLRGVEHITGYFRQLASGKKPFHLVLWWDEVEKSGISNTGGTSDVNDDQLGQMLSFMEDNDIYGTMCVGAPGTGKSQLCKCMSGEFDVLVIRFDLGAMQGSLVGQSQQQLRQALRVVKAIGGNDIMVIATSNSISGLDTALRSRFTDVFFFDLPSDEQLKAIWPVWLERCGLPADSPLPDDSGWVGRNIRQCCDKAARMGLTVKEAAEYIVPVADSVKEQIESLRREADGKYLDAAAAGVYRKPREVAGGKKKRTVEGS